MLTIENFLRDVQHGFRVVEQSGRVCILNELASKYFFPHESAMGRSPRKGGDEES
jgi:hypothetical protein